MTRRETYCGGRLVKEIDQIDVSTWEDVARSRPPRFVDGGYIWWLDGEEITPVEAEAFRIVWDAQPHTA
ncbi:hypothetical protein ACWGQ5_47445 [Streptomyces sp. NPDC055722]